MIKLPSKGIQVRLFTSVKMTQMSLVGQCLYKEQIIVILYLNGKASMLVRNAELNKSVLFSLIVMG